MKAALVLCVALGVVAAVRTAQAQQARRVNVDLLPAASTTWKLTSKGPNAPLLTAAAGTLQIKLPATGDDYAWFDGPELPLAPGSAWRLRFTVAAGPDVAEKAIFGVGYQSLWNRQIVSTLQAGVGWTAIKQYEQGQQDPMMLRAMHSAFKRGPGEANTIELVQRDGGIELSINGQFAERSNPLDVPPHRLRLVTTGGTWTLSELRFETLGPDTRWSRLRLENMALGQKVLAKGLRQQVSKGDYDKGGVAN